MNSISGNESVSALSHENIVRPPGDVSHVSHTLKGVRRDNRTTETHGNNPPRFLVELRRLPGWSTSPTQRLRLAFILTV